MYYKGTIISTDKNISANMNYERIINNTIISTDNCINITSNNGFIIPTNNGVFVNKISYVTNNNTIVSMGNMNHRETININEMICEDFFLQRIDFSYFIHHYHQIRFIDGLLLYNIYNQNLEAIKKNIKDGANVNVQRGEPLILGIKNNNLSIIIILAENGANIDDSKLIHVHEKQIDIIKYFMEKEVNDTSKYIDALKRSIYYDISVIKFLIDHDVNIRYNDDGILRHSVLMNDLTKIAAILPYYKIEDLKLLLNDNNIRDKIKRVLLKADLSQYTELIQVYREYGVDIYDMIDKEYSL